MSKADCDRRYRAKHFEEIRTQKRGYYTVNKEHFINRARTWQEANPEQTTTQKMLRNKVSRGVMPPARDSICTDCPRQAAEYDHYLGYSKEHRYDVQPVCKSCHVKRGPYHTRGVSCPSLED